MLKKVLQISSMLHSSSQLRTLNIVEELIQLFIESPKSLEAFATQVEQTKVEYS
jgi:hypothetical protein